MAPVEGPLTDFWRALCDRWPEVLASRTWGRSPWTSDFPTLRGLLDVNDILTFARDQQMVDHLGEFARLPMADNEGAVSVVVSPASESGLGVSTGWFRFDGTANHDIDPMHLEFVPTKQARWITLITPTDPKLGGFSAELLEMFMAAFDV